MKNTGIILASLAGGIAVGAALALLYTPKTGVEMRHKIKDSLNKELAKLKDTIEELREEVKEEQCYQCQEE